MPWLEQRPNGCYHVVFRFAGQKLKKSLKTTNRRSAEARLCQLEENIRLIEKGRIDLPGDVDLVEFLLSDGKLGGKHRSNFKLRTLKQFSKAFLASIPKPHDTISWNLSRPYIQVSCENLSSDLAPAIFGFVSSFRHFLVDKAKKHGQLVSVGLGFATEISLLTTSI